MVMTASGYRSLPGTTVGVAGRHDGEKSSLAHVSLPHNHTFLVSEQAS